MIINIKYLVFSFVFTFLFMGNIFSMDEPPGYFEPTNGSATFKRLRELEDEKILDVNSNVRILGNFLRIRDQFIRLKKEHDNYKETYNSLREKIPSLQSCISNHIKEERREIRQDESKAEIIVEVGYGKINKDCLSEFQIALGNLPKKLYKIPENKNWGSLGEKWWHYEYYIGLSGTHSVIREIAKDMDVKEEVRARDNLNRCRKQIIEKQIEINEQISEFDSMKKLLKCVTQKFNSERKKEISIESISGHVTNCFEDYTTDYKLFDNGK